MVKEKELSSADKCRRTKLCKKSIEELVNIVLRKDDVERRSSKTIETYKKLQVTNEKIIATLKDSLFKSEEIQNNQEVTIAALNATLSNKEKAIDNLQKLISTTNDKLNASHKTIEARTKELRVSFIVIVVLLMMLASSIIL